MHIPRRLRCFALLLAGTALAPVYAQSPVQDQAAGLASVSEWLTAADRSAMLALQPEHPSFAARKNSASGNAAPPITVDPSRRFQQMDGFGFALTGGSAQLLHQMSPGKRLALLKHLFGSEPGSIHVSYLRVSIGASDMNERVYTYDDMPAGQTDPSLAKFSVDPDLEAVVPTLKLILAINPNISILASPWSAPSWMKSNDLPKAGSLLPQFYPVYAQYLVDYLQAMATRGIKIRALTMQNEPLNANNTPSMIMTAAQQATFLADALGPALQKAHLPTEVILYDHNLDRPDYPLDVLANTKAASYAAGSGFHLYEGSVGAMSQVHDAHPEKALFFTEQMVTQENNAVPLRIAESVSRIIIGATRNWSQVVLLWNLAADPHDGPHTSDGGCPVCQGAITIDDDTWTPNLAYDTIAQISKFVPPGSVRIASNGPTTDILPNVAFSTPDRRTVLLVANPDSMEQSFDVLEDGRSFHATLHAGDVATFVWPSFSSARK